MTIRVQYKVFLQIKINTCKSATKCRRIRSAELPISRAVGGVPRMILPSWASWPVRPRRAEGQTVEAPPKCRSMPDAATRSARVPDAPSPNCQLPKLHRGRPLGAGAETKTTTDDSTSPRAVTPRPRPAQILRPRYARVRKRRSRTDSLRTCVIRCVLALLPLSLSTYKFSIMYV